jgi:hypothetical protein
VPRNSRCSVGSAGSIISYHVPRIPSPVSRLFISLRFRSSLIVHHSSFSVSLRYLAGLSQFTLHCSSFPARVRLEIGERPQFPPLLAPPTRVGQDPELGGLSGAFLCVKGSLTNLSHAGKIGRSQGVQAASKKQASAPRAGRRLREHETPVITRVQVRWLYVTGAQPAGEHHLVIPGKGVGCGQSEG